MQKFKEMLMIPCRLKFTMFRLLIIPLVLGACSTPRPSPTPAVSATLPEPTITLTPQATLTATEIPDRIERDIEYITDGGAYQSLDVYLPTSGNGPFPTILAIHGGAFKYRTKGLYQFIAGHYTDLGYAVVSTNYRLTQKASYPAQVEDVFCALGWIYANHAEYGFDTEHVFVTGGSAGGYLAAMVGTVDTPGIYLENCPYALPDKEWIRGMIIFYGFFDFTTLEGYSDGDVTTNLQPYWGAKYSDIPNEILMEMSPMSWVDGSEPPTLLIHGTADTSVPSWMSESFAAELEEAGVDVELLLLDAGHAFELKSLSYPAMVESFEAIDPFLSRLVMK